MQSVTKADRKRTLKRIENWKRGYEIALPLLATTITLICAFYFDMGIQLCSFWAIPGGILAKFRDAQKAQRVAAGCAALLVIIVIVFVLYMLNRVRNMKNAEGLKELELIDTMTGAMSEAIQEINREKVQSVLRHTYSEVSKWNPINYCVNTMHYDIHEYIRKMLCALETTVISLDHDRFTYNNITVSLAFSYLGENAKKATEKGNEKKKAKDVRAEEDKSPKETTKKGDDDRKDNKWTIIDSGDFSGGIGAKSFLEGELEGSEGSWDEDSFWSYVYENDYGFANLKSKRDQVTLVVKPKKQAAKPESQEEVNDANNKEQSQENNEIQLPHSAVKQKKLCFRRKCGDEKQLPHYTWSEKDTEFNYGEKPQIEKKRKVHKFKAGSIVGKKVVVRNDDKELVESILIINTYGEPLCASKKAKDVKLYEKCFKECILDCFTAMLASELSQMYVRHAIMEGEICRFSGKPLCKKQ